MKKVKVGIIGCGTIGLTLADAIQKKFKERARLSAISDRHYDRITLLKKKSTTPLKVLSVDSLIKEVDVVVEAAAPSVVPRIVREAVRQRKHTLVMSLGGLLKLPKKFLLSEHAKRLLWIPSGALTGVDGLVASRESEVHSVKLITRKPPEGLMSAPYFERRKFPKLTGKKEVCVFRGSAFEAVQKFPQNINVSACLALGGLGPKKTRVEIWTSKAYKANQHEVFIRSDSGTIHTVTTNKPSPSNPKTSHLAVLSAVATLRKVLEKM